MKLRTILEDGEPIVKIQNLPEYEVENPETGDVKQAEKEQETKDVIVKKGSEAEKELKKEVETNKEIKEKPTKALVCGLLDAVKAFIQAI